MLSGGDAWRKPADTAIDTPIFHALTTGGWIPRQHEPAAADRWAGATDPVAEFERDPLSAPIPHLAPISHMAEAEPPFGVIHGHFTSAPSSRRGRHRQRMSAPRGGYRLHISPD